MSFFDQRSLSLIPRRTRKWVLAVLLATTAGSLALAVSLALRGVSDPLVSVTLTTFQTSAFATAFWLVFMIGQKAQSREDLLGQISEVLLVELPSSIRSYSMQEPKLEVIGGRHRQAPPSNISEFKIAHARGTTTAVYEMTWFMQPIRMYIQMNVTRISVVYMLPESTNARFSEMFSSTIIGAKSAGWDVHEYGVQKSHYWNEEASFAELAALRMMNDEFLHDPIQRLFITNDIAAMTLSVAVSWHRWTQRQTAR